MSNRYVGGVITEKVNVAQAPWSGAWTEQAQLQAKAQGTWAPLNAQIGNSLRFRSSASAYLNRTPSVAGNRKTWTWSAWVKRGSLGANSYPFACAYAASDSGFLGIYFNSDDTLAVSGFNTYWRKTTQVFRDPSAWYHIVVAFDTTQATGANRVKMYINGVQVTAFGTSNDPTLNTDYPINNNQPHFHSCYSLGTPTNFFDGYLAEVNFIDGQALTPAAFGMFDANTGVWKPTVYGGTYGTNGFHLPFSNGTSTITLGYDTSGNSNNWTCNNISLTAGSTYDWMLDSPTPLVGTSYGVGNYCVLNPLNGSVSATSDGNLTASKTTGVYSFGTVGMMASKYYWEVRINANGSQDLEIGVVQTIATINNTAGAYGWGTKLSRRWDNGVLTSTSIGTATVGDIVGIALDLTAATFTVYKNGAQLYQTTGVVAGTYFPAITAGGAGGSDSITANFGQRPFAYSPPSGYKTLCTYNLPAPAIANGANYMAATTYTGLGVAQAINNTVNGVYFKPDFVWIKSRSASQSNSLQDSVRGITLQLSSNLTAAEITSSGEVTALNATGFSLGGDVSGYGTNTAATTYIGWQWKAGGTAVTNTNGSITSQVSASALSGFSVVTYTGTGSAATVGHGLGVAPSMIIVKSRTNISPYGGWPVYHVTQGNNKGCFLNTTAAVNSQPNLWNSTTPTSSVFSIGTDQETNYSTANFVAYCFAAIAGYSAFGSYTGNGSADGPFVYCGFRPRFVMVKMSSGVEVWAILDTARDTYNVAYKRLLPNSSSAENTGDANVMDILSNGFKLRSTDTTSNGNGSTYIYAAFAENPFQNALAR